jgi:DNA-binding transcriptional LysR family regulator
MMNLRHIEVFHAVYQAGSVSGAARALHVSQPSVSKVLRHAESRIGFALFRVVKGRLVPTEEAHVLFREARDLQARIESLQETTKNLRRGGDGHLRLAVLPSLGLDIAPSAVARFRASHPDISFDIQTLHNDEVLASLYERNSDLALTHDGARHPRLTETQVGAGELVVLFRREDLDGAPERISLEMLKPRDLIRLTGSGHVGSLFSRELDQDEPVRAGISVQTYYVAAGLVRRGAGVAVVDEFTARASLTPDLDYRRLVEKPEFNVYCLHLEDRPLSRIAREFIGVLRQTIQSAQA